MGGVKIKPVSTIKLRLGINPNGRVQKFMTERCAMHMDKYVPTTNTAGGLREIKSIQSSSITYMSPHAHYQFIGKKYVDPITKKGSFYSPKYGHWSRPNVTKIRTNQNLRYHTPGTGSHWDRKMVSAEIGEVCKEVKNYIRKGSK